MALSLIPWVGEVNYRCTLTTKVILHNYFQLVANMADAVFLEYSTKLIMLILDTLNPPTTFYRFRSAPFEIASDLAIVGLS